jgi:peptidoglycan/LPS O-acetylase OafA/YrhL
MSFLDPLPWFALCALSLAVGAAVSFASPFYRARLAESEAGRFETLDGLRGFLALGVLGGHAVNMYTLHAEGVWTAANAPFYHFAARTGVALFFMITAFLFWLRVLRAGEAFDWRAFYLSRVRRLTPMYAASVLLALVVICGATGFAPRDSLADVARDLRPWLSFGFMDTGAVNGMQNARYVNAVYWTLAYEWAFYLALPCLALFARRPWGAALAAAVLFFGSQAPVVWNFLFGAAAALIVHRRTLEGPLSGRLAAPWLGALALAALAAAYAAREAHAMVQTLLLFVFFVLVVHGCSLFGLLRSRPAKVLGTVSYSLYLVHCIVLFAAVHAADRLAPIATLSPSQYWVLALLAGTGAVALSLITYRYVEYPWIAAGAQKAGAVQGGTILRREWLRLWRP